MHIEWELETDETVTARRVEDVCNFYFNTQADVMTIGVDGSSWEMVVIDGVWTVEDSSTEE